MPDRPPSALLTRQWLWTEHDARWRAYILERGWRLTPGEGRIYQLGPDNKRGRKARLIVGQKANGSPTYGGIVRVRDLAHLDGGNHYAGLCSDDNLWVPELDPELMTVAGWRLITAGGTKEWLEAGEVWEQLHKLCRWGGRFGDDNHRSILNPDGKTK